MIVKRDKIAFFLNESFLGIAFCDPEIAKSTLFPFVAFCQERDEVKVCPGKIRKLNN